MKIIKVLSVVIALVVIVAAVAYALRHRIADAMIAHRLHGVDRGLLADGKIHVILCGTGAPQVDPQRACACTAVIAGGQFVMIDAGPGSIRQADLSHLPLDALSAVLLTHFHSDHFGGLGETIQNSWMSGRRVPLAVYGPEGVEDIVAAFQRAYARDTQYRSGHLGEALLPRAGAQAIAHTFHVDGDSATLVFEQNGLRILAFAVDHQPVVPAVGYRLEYGGRVVVISGDTRKSDRVIRHASNADLLIHEGMQKELVEHAARALDRLGDHDRASQLRTVMSYHTTPVEAAEVAAQAHVNTLVLTHVIPPLRNFVMRWLYLRGTHDRFSGPVVLGEDGMHFEL